MAHFKTGFTLAILGIGISLTLAQPTYATTFTVEKDGTGDYTVIQDAVDAAASGDTISIGPGRFDDKHYVTSIGWSDSVQVLVPQHELTIIGSGPKTIIGQANSWAPEQGLHKGIVASDYWGNSIIHISNLHLENMRDAIYCYQSLGQGVVEVQNCSFYQNFISLILGDDGGKVSVQDCTFNYMPLSGVHIICWDQNNLQIQRCTFRLLNYYPWSQGSVSLINVANGLIEDCNFLEGSTGFVAGYGGPIIVRNCLFDGQSNTAVSSEIQSHIAIDKCTFRNQTRVMVSGTGDNQASITNSVIEDVSDCSFLMSYFGPLTINNCDLAAGDRGVVYFQDIPNCNVLQHIDMTNNYWGTDDPDSIQTLIWDHNDSDEACYYVDYEPFMKGTTPVKKKSLGSIKAMFR